MWAGTRDFANGIFHEPRFYGQDYNSLMESLFAVPLYWLGVPLYRALPIVSSLLMMVPYLMLSWLVFKKRSKEVGILLLLLLFTFPLMYDLVTATSRGFVTGIAIATGTLVALFYKEKRAVWFFAVFSAVVAFSINPNSVIVTIPCLIGLYSVHYRNKAFYVISVLGLISGLVVHLSLNLFYVYHPNYILHGYGFSIDFEAFAYGISHLDSLLKDVSPIFWKQGWMPLLICIVLGITFYKKRDFKMAWVTLCTPLFVLIAMCVSKVYDGSDWVFFPINRMFLALPLVILLGLGMLPFRWRKWYWCVAIVPLLTVIHKISSYDEFMEVQKYKSGPVVSVEIDEFKSSCTKLKEFALKNKIDLIIIENDPIHGIITYGCSACEEKLPNILFPIYDRRTWRLLEDEYRVYNRILIVTAWRRFDLEYGAKRISIKHPEWQILYNNQLPTQRLLDKLGFLTRRYQVLI